MITSLPTPDAYQISFANLYFARPVKGRLLAGEYPSAKSTAEVEAKLARFLNSGVTFFLDLTEAREYSLRPYETAVQHMAAARGQAITHHRMAIPDLTYSQG